MNNKAGATCEFQGPKVTNVMVSEGFLYKDKHGSCAFSAFFFFFTSTECGVTFTLM